MSCYINASTYISAGYNYGQFIYKPMSQYNVAPQGGGFGLTYGMSYGAISTEFFYNKLSMTGAFIHDDTNNNFNHEATNYGIAAAAYLNKYLYLRVGYQITSIDQSFTSIDSATDNIITNSYGVLENYSGKGFLIGAGLNLYAGKSWLIYSQFTSTQVHDEGKDMLMQLGLRVSFGKRKKY
jgi:hypothetical protein